MLSKYFIAFLLSLSGLSPLLAQEVVRGLNANPSLYSNKAETEYRSRLLENTTFVYQLDSIDLPFIDDFSYARQKSFNGDTVGLTYIFDTVNSLFLNGVMADTIIYSSDTSWHYTVGKADSAMNPTFQVVRLNTSVYPAIPLDTNYYWPNYTVEDQSGVNPPDTTYFTADTLTNLQTIFTVIDDDNTLWTGRGVFFNSTYPINPPTFGVATFDAIDEFGKMYSNGGSTVFIGDSLTSKSVKLEGLDSTNNVYLSFYLESKGNGDEPEDKDSLVLRFLDENGDWHSVWNTETVSTWPTDTFLGFYVKLTDSLYFHDGFKFQFYNYASINGFGGDQGNRDHWHLDYVVLDQNRSLNDSYISDVAFVYPPKSLVNGYTSMPWKHFKSASGLMETTSETSINNISNASANISFGTEIREKGTQVYLSASAQNFSLTSDGNQILNENYSGYTYNSAESDSAVFEVRYGLTSDLAVEFAPNDTAKYYQYFNNYYSYDDGSSEAGYGFYTSAKFALKYTVVEDKGDSLRGVLAFFNESLEGINKQVQIKYTIWDYSSGKPGNILYEHTTAFPSTEDSLNKFVFIEFDEVLHLSDTFFVGITQNASEFVNIGLDLNDDNSSKLYYNTSGSWKNSSVAGTVMLRPVFGDKVEIPDAVRQIGNIEFSVYPNPAQELLNIDLQNSAEGHVLKIFDVSGRIVYSSELKSKTQLNVSHIGTGIYFVEISENSGSSKGIQKLIISK